MRQGLITACAAAIVWIMSGEASAEGSYQVVVFPVVPLVGEVSMGPARDMSAAVFEELALNPQIGLVSGQAGSDGAANEAITDPAQYRQGLIDLEEGAQQAGRLRFGKAIDALQSGIDRLHDNLGLLDSHERLVEAYLQLSVAYFRRGKEAAGTELLESVARLDPTRTLQADRFPPLFLRAFEQARKRASSAPRGAIRVTSSPPGADVSLNGRAVGRTPLVIEQVPSGHNHVVVRGAAGVWARRIAVRAGPAAEALADFDGTGPRPMGPQWDALGTNHFDREDRRSFARQIGASGAEWGVVLVMGRARGVYTLGGFLGNSRTGKWATLEAVAPDFDLFSASIEAHALGRNIVAAIKSFTPDVRAESVPALAGRRMRKSKSPPGPAENRVRFLGGVVSGGHAIDPNRLVALPARAGRGTKQGPAGRDSPLPSGKRLSEVPPPHADPGGTTFIDGRSIAAVDPIHAEGDPMTPPDLLVAESTGPELLSQWWFWTAVGVGIVGIGAGSWALLRDPGANDVRVEAVW